jgi:hypothetical protein
MGPSAVPMTSSSSHWTLMAVADQTDARYIPKQGEVLRVTL